MAGVTSQCPFPTKTCFQAWAFSGIGKEGRAGKTFSLFRTEAGERKPLEPFYLPAKGARAFFLPLWLQDPAGIRARPSAALTCGQRLTKPTHGSPVPGGPSGSRTVAEQGPGALSERWGLRHADAPGVWAGTSDSSSRATRALTAMSRAQGADAAGLTPCSVAG